MQRGHGHPAPDRHHLSLGLKQHCWQVPTPVLPLVQRASAHAAACAAKVAIWVMCMQTHGLKTGKKINKKVEPGTSRQWCLYGDRKGESEGTRLRGAQLRHQAAGHLVPPLPCAARSSRSPPRGLQRRTRASWMLCPLPGGFFPLCTKDSCAGNNIKFPRMKDYAEMVSKGVRNRGKPLCSFHKIQFKKAVQNIT